MCVRVTIVFHFEGLSPKRREQLLNIFPLNIRYINIEICNIDILILNIRLEIKTLSKKYIQYLFTTFLS